MILKGTVDTILCDPLFRASCPTHNGNLGLNGFMEQRQRRLPKFITFLKFSITWNKENSPLKPLYSEHILAGILELEKCKV